MGGESSVEKSVLMSVVFPKPLSPSTKNHQYHIPGSEIHITLLTNDHDRKVRALLGYDLVFLHMIKKKKDSSTLHFREPFRDTHLVGKVGDTDASSGEWGRHVLRREESEGVT